MTHPLSRRVGTVALAVAVPLTGLAAVPASAAPAGTVVTRRDVDGDKRKDAVHFSSDGSVLTISVDRARGRTLSKRLRTSGVDGGIWHGAAAIDGRRGAELVVVVKAGAHTLYNTVLTIRGGRLVTARTPAGAARWVTDSANSANIGWRRFKDDGRTYVTKRSVGRDEDGAWVGRAVTYRWTSDGWRKSGKARTLRPTSDRVAYRLGGWRVAGLRVFP
ncbi:hypothetical protein [Solicola sp. PLA-1-18]|uniref:hypothetical protein n=1 Tax=Solicola sp. PLA-1-18 TaxID=3380532 RepID=UPI003B75EF15